MKGILVILFSIWTAVAMAQSQSPRIASVKLYRVGDQTSLPVLALNGGDALQLDFDDLDTRIRNYYYTFQHCDADWTPSILKPYDYIKGFQTVRISNYRNSSIATTRYVHYQAQIPDRNCAPSRTGNYLLKVYLDNDTSKVAFTRRFLVIGNEASIATQIQQPFNSRFFRSYQKLFIGIKTDPRVRVLSPNDLKVVVLQNNNWQTALTIDRPTLFRGNYFEYSDEAITAMPAGKEFRWLDLRSLRLLSDRVQKMQVVGDTQHVLVKPDVPRNSQSYIFYRDLNGAYTMESLDNANPFWQSDYAYVHFSFVPPGNEAIPGNDVYLFSEATQYAADTSSRLTFNKELGVYEKVLLLKQGYYSYAYITRPANNPKAQPDFSQTEGDHWGTENSYTILVYFRPFGARGDELIGSTTLNSTFDVRR